MARVFAYKQCIILTLFGHTSNTIGFLCINGIKKEVTGMATSFLFMLHAAFS
jgi:hypothetical protein